MNKKIGDKGKNVGVTKKKNSKEKKVDNEEDGFETDSFNTDVVNIDEAEGEEAEGEEAEGEDDEGEDDEGEEAEGEDDEGEEAEGEDDEGEEAEGEDDEGEEAEGEEAEGEEAEGEDAEGEEAEEEEKKLEEKKINAIPTKKNDLKKFNWKKYLYYYQDLYHLDTMEEAWDHWMEYGRYEKRTFFLLDNEKTDEKYDKNEIKNEMKNFDWKSYINFYPDLKKLDTKEMAWDHWIHHGKEEKRKYFTLDKTDRINEKDEYKKFDWKTYLKNYSDLKKINNKEEAWYHWMTYGKNEKRVTYDLKKEELKKYKELKKKEKEITEKEEKEKEMTKKENENENEKKKDFFF